MSDKELLIFGNTIKELRSQAGLTQEDLAGETGLDFTSVNEIENGHRNPTLRTILKLAKVLQVKPSALLVAFD